MSLETDEQDTLSDHFFAVRGDPEGPEDLDAERILADVRQRLFGIASEPQRIGRFVIVDRLGAGGMGVVYLGYDRELDRSVAIKLLRAPHHRAEASPAKARARLLREARALARVDHPNVIAIHEVGVDDEAVFLAMERAEGSTLGAWQRAAARPWRELVAVYVQAGRGLAAAHAAGVIHRDFKPENVLISGDPLGLRVRVVDFGLARAESDEPSSDGENPGDGGDRPPPAGPSEGGLTAAGALLGTPRYMAPEQLAGGVADARSDQFSFAVALYEGLTAEHPFVDEGAGLGELRAAVLGGQRRPLPRGHRLPRWLRRILDRALCVAPEGRFPAMLALLAAIERGLGRRRRQRLIVGGVGLALAAAFVGSVASQPTRCNEGSRALVGVWNPGIRAELRGTFLASDRAFAARAATEVERRIDAYAAAWAAMYDDACAATHRRGEQSSAALDLRMGCLERRRHELASLLEIFTERPLDPATVARAIEATDALTPLAGCADLVALTAPEPLPEDPRLREAVDQLRRRIAETKALGDAGRYQDALALATRIDAEAEALGYRPLSAETALLLGALAGQIGDFDGAAAAFDRGLVEGLASGHLESAAWSAIHAIHVVGFVGHRPVEGRRWAHLAEPLVDRLGRPPRALASLHANLGNVAVVEGDLEEAETRFLAAIDLAERHLGANDVLLAKTSANLGAVYRRRGEHQAALAAYHRASAIFDASFGPEHPVIATLANNIGALLWTIGDLDGAEASYRRVLALANGTLDPLSPTLGHANNNLGEVYLARREWAPAIAHYRAAIAIWEHSHGEDHPLLAHPLVGLGRALVAAGTPEPALARLERGLALREGAGAPAAEIEEAEVALAEARLALGRGDEEDT